MTEEERDEKLKQADELVKKAVPKGFTGSVTFHQAPGMKKVKVNVDQTIVLDGK